MQFDLKFANEHYGKPFILNIKLIVLVLLISIAMYLLFDFKYNIIYEVTREMLRPVLIIIILANIGALIINVSYYIYTLNKAKNTLIDIRDSIRIKYTFGTLTINDVIDCEVTSTHLRLTCNVDNSTQTVTIPRCYTGEELLINKGSYNGEGRE